MTHKEGVIWLTNIISDIGKMEHRSLWHYAQALTEIKNMLQDEPQWTSCYDELPKRESEDQMRSWFLTTNNLGNIGLTRYEFDSGTFGCVGWNGDLEIVAWRELPKPWEGVKHDTGRSD